MNPTETARCYWLTGLPGAGKSTIASLAAHKLHAQDHRVKVLDGDELRMGLNRGLGFSREDRAENVRRIGEAAALLVSAGVTVLISSIAPYRADRAAAYERIGIERCFEVFVDTGLATCVERDPKGLYARAKRGEVANLTGWDDPYEPPLAADIHLQTVSASAEFCALQIVTHCLSFSLEREVAKEF